MEEIKRDYNIRRLGTMLSFQHWKLVVTTFLVAMLMLTAVGARQDGPIVSTAPVVRVLEGSNATLPCNYNRSVYAVYWYKGTTPSPDSLLMYLDVFHGGGKRDGPEYISGRVNMTDDFKLIIYVTSLQDHGQYTCEISDYLLGTLFKNNTDLTVIERMETIVTTVPLASFYLGLDALLPCSYKRNISTVTWYRGNASSIERKLISLFAGDADFSKRSSERFRVTAANALVISDVNFKDEGRYTCKVNDFSLKESFYNHTDVEIIVIAKGPFLRISYCEGPSGNPFPTDGCTVRTADIGRKDFRFECSVVGGRPVVKLTWLLNGQISPNISKTRVEGLDNGTYIVTATISDIRVLDTAHNLTCKAEGAAVNGSAVSVVFLNHSRDNGVDIASLVVGVVIPIIVIIVAVTVVLLWRVWKRRNRGAYIVSRRTLT